MFVRIRERKLKEGLTHYAYLVNNQWNPVRKKHEQKIVACLGSIRDLPIDGTIEKIIVALDIFSSKMGFASLANGLVISNVAEEKFLTESLEYGSFLLAQHVLRELGFQAVFKRLARKYTTNVAFSSLLGATTAMITRRFYPSNDISELATWEWYEKEVWFPQKTVVSKDDLYRTLDFLNTGKDEIEKEYYEKNLTLFNSKLDLVLFDTTSIYYYGQEDKIDEESLLQYGFSKDGKSNLKQVIIGVLMTTEGVPIAHEVFRGDTTDVKAFLQIITIIKKKYNLGRIILVADRGMVSEDNLVHLEQSQLSYIVGIRMRMLPYQLKKKLLVPLDEKDPTEDMEKISDNLYTKEFPVKRFTAKEIKELFLAKIKKGKTATFDEKEILEAIKKRRFFVCLNPFVAQANKKKREYFKKIIENKIKNTPTKEWVIKNGYRKYLKFEKGLEPTLNEERLKDEEIYDGKWVLMTNDEHVSSYNAGTYYKSLQFVERGFEDLKSLISIRPIYHFKEERIKAHIFVCFLALIIKWYLCRIINPLSQDEGRRFIEEMIRLKAITVDPSIPLYLRTAISPETQEEMKRLRMRIPGKVILDGRLKPNPISHKPGRPKKVDPNQFQLPFLTKKSP